MCPNEPFTIASVAKTLAELKKLPLQDQAMVLLRGLGHMFPKNRTRYEVRSFSRNRDHPLTPSDKCLGDIALIGKRNFNWQ